MTCYTGDDPLTFDSSIAKLKDAFINLLPEICDRGNQQQITSLKENFPCVRASTQTNPGLLAQAKLKDQETLSNLNEVLEAFPRTQKHSDQITKQIKLVLILRFTYL